jgi:hypothetical protein
MKWRIQEFDPEWNWETIDSAENEKDALLKASDNCPFLDDGTNTRIITPDGDIL